MLYVDVLELIIKLYRKNKNSTFLHIQLLFAKRVQFYKMLSLKSKAVVQETKQLRPSI